MLVVVASTLASCTIIKGRSASDSVDTHRATEPECVPYQRDLSRPWNSKRGYCTGYDQASYHPVVTTDTSTGLDRNQSILVGKERKEFENERQPISLISVPVREKTETIVSATVTAPETPIPLITVRDRVIDFPLGSSELTPVVEERVNLIMDEIDTNEDVSVVWLQASLIEEETHRLNLDKDALGIERSLVVKKLLEDKGIRDVRIMYSIVDADKSTVRIILKGDA